MRTGKPSLVSQAILKRPNKPDAAQHAAGLYPEEGARARALRWIPLWCALSISAAAVLAWEARHSMNPDGIAYLDMASETLRSGPHNLVNAHWGPLYPFFIAILFSLFHPSPAMEFPLVHLLNWLVFAAAAASFSFFLRNWLREQHSAADDVGVTKTKSFVPFAFLLFFWFTTKFPTVSLISLVTPDLCVVAFALLSAGLVCRLSRPSAGWKNFAGLGGVLGLGYYAKPAVFLMALLLLLVLFCFPPSPRPCRRGIALATLTFLAVSAPLVTFESKRLGRLSVSEVGNWNYLKWVNKVEYLDLIRGGKAVHPPRILIDKPLTLEFALPIAGTYPLQYDPAYWIEGERPEFNIRQEFAALIVNLRVCGGFLLRVVSLCAGVLAFGLSFKRQAAGLHPGGLWVFVWPLAVCAALSLVYIEDRYVVAFVLLFWLAVYRFLIAHADKLIARAVVTTVFCSLLIPLTLRLVSAAGGTLRDVGDQGPPAHLMVAQTLQSSGIGPGDQVAVVGSGVGAHYARLARVRIIAEISDVRSFWQLGPEDLKKTEDRLAGIGAKALVAPYKPDGLRQGEWREVPGTIYSFLALRKP